MKNGHYEYIIDTGLAKNITDFTSRVWANLNTSLKMEEALKTH